MKIRIDLWAPTFVDFGGGITAFSGALVRALAGHEIRLLGKNDCSTSFEGKLVSGTGSWPAKLRTLAFSAKLFASAMRKKPALIVSTHVNFGPMARVLSRLRGIPYALVAHGIDVGSQLSASRVNALHNADVVITVSRWTKDRLVNLNRVPAARIRIVPNTVDPSRFKVVAPSMELRNRYGISSDDRIVLTVARLDASEGYKGYDQVVRCLPWLRARVENIRYVIVGKGDDEPRLRQLVEELGVSDIVTFTGFVTDDELPAHYQMADVFAMPSRGEGFGIVFLEAMACGVPALAGNQDGSTDALADGELGMLVDPGDCSQIQEAMLSLLRGEGPAWWFEPEQLRTEMLSRFGPDAFKEHLHKSLDFALTVPEHH